MLNLDMAMEAVVTNSEGENSEDTMSVLTSEQESEDIVDVLSMSPFAAAVGCREHSYGIITAGQKRFKCSCQSGQCGHLAVFEPWNKDNQVYDFDIESGVTGHRMFKSVSTEKIPWPLPAEKKSLYMKLRKGRPAELCPTNVPEKCVHGVKLERVLIAENATLHAEDAAEDGHKVYAYKTKTNCCKVDYDGSQHLLLNLDNQHLFCYTWLFGILCKTQETQFPLQAALRASISLREDIACSLQTTYYQLYNAYNCFTR